MMRDQDYQEIEILEKNQDLIWTPDHPLFDMVLNSNLPPGSTANFYGVRDGMLVPMNERELNDYLWGGEYDELDQSGDDYAFN